MTKYLHKGELYRHPFLISRHIHHRVRARTRGGLRGKFLEGVQDHLQGTGLQLHPRDLHDASGETVRRTAEAAAATRIVWGARAKARDGVQNLVRVGVQHDLLAGGKAVDADVHHPCEINYPLPLNLFSVPDR